MSYHLWIEDDARSEIKRLPGHVRQQIERAMKDLCHEPRPHNSRQLRIMEGIELETRRLRLDQWRVVYIVDEEWSEIGVLAIRKRPPYDYHDLPTLLARLG